MSVVVAELLVTSVSIAIINVSRRFMAHGGMLLNTSNCSPMNADNPDFCEKKYFSSIRLSASLCTNYSLLLRWYWFIFLIYLKITYLPSLEVTSLQEIIFKIMNYSSFTKKTFYLRRPFFTSHASARANPPPINNKTPHGNFFSTVGQSKIAGTDLRGRLSPGKA